jgi:hypothetical protein
MGRDTENWDSLDPRVLREAFGRIDPLPPGLSEELSEAFELRRSDAELARLTAEDVDGTSSGAPRAGPARTLVFESDRCALTVVWSPDPDDRSGLVDLDGTVERAVPAALLIETPKRTTNGVVDGQRIVAEGLQHGPVRLCLVMSDVEPWLLETEWITV